MTDAATGPAATPIVAERVERTFRGATGNEIHAVSYTHLTLPTNREV